MRSGSFLVLVVFLVLGTLATQAAVTGVPPKGQGTDKGDVLIKRQDPVKAQSLLRGLITTKPGVCPRILIRCAMLNPPNRCWSDAGCPGAKKCCEGYCGRACLDPR
ncbi:PREDICTED: elafin [Ceratotherium simum simum]|uniref:Elafin n=1 Tax=Ceratotherium simum simum TaxID=73337 RepID=A0ABM0HN01_CERSS|nr:PREDICTED: elafin [Ceratotherium simum simum]XP_014643070.1 PREDICTED: elafin [Ceratotherium simum simum]